MIPDMIEQCKKFIRRNTYKTKWDRSTERLRELSVTDFGLMTNVGETERKKS
jgi:hypothetical protein